MKTTPITPYRSNFKQSFKSITYDIPENFKRVVLKDLKSNKEIQKLGDMGEYTISYAKDSRCLVFYRTGRNPAYGLNAHLAGYNYKSVLGELNAEKLAESIDKKEVEILEQCNKKEREKGKIRAKMKEINKDGVKITMISHSYDETENVLKLLNSKELKKIYDKHSITAEFKRDEGNGFRRYNGCCEIVELKLADDKDISTKVYLNEDYSNLNAQEVMNDFSRKLASKIFVI